MVIDGSWQLKVDDTLSDGGPSTSSGWRRRSLGAFRPARMGGRRPERGDGFWD